MERSNRGTVGRGGSDHNREGGEEMRGGSREEDAGRAKGGRREGEQEQQGHEGIVSSAHKLLLPLVGMQPNVCRHNLTIMLQTACTCTDLANKLYNTTGMACSACAI